MKLINQILWFINIFVALLLFLSYLAHYINPESIAFPALLGLAFPFLLIINVIFLIYWIFSDRRKMILSAVVIALGFGHIGRFWQASGKVIPENKKGNSIKLISYNVQLFGLYNWDNNIETRDSIINYLEKKQPNILCLQEYYERNFSGFETTTKLQKALSAKNIHKEFSLELKNGQKFGMASFLDYPIVNKGRIDFENSYNMCIYTDFIWSDDTVRLYNIHLQSVQFSEDDYNDVDSINIPSINKEKLSDYNSIVKKLYQAFKIRANQALIIEEHLQQSTYPVIVCGDFNDTPLSFSYHQISKGLKDAFQESGSGFGFSFKRKYLRMRIDHILHSKDYEAYDYLIDEIMYSDHFPVYCRISKDK